MASPTERARQYAEQVVSGELLSCKWAILACQRFMRDLERQGTDDFPFIFDEQKADRVVLFIERLPHVKGTEWAGRKLTLEGWQCFIECNIFGWVHKDKGFRRFRTSFELIPRKNGKSVRVGARGIYLAFLDGESGAEVYCGATSEKQAFEVYRPAWQMVKSLPKLQEQADIALAGNPNNPGTMYRSRDMSKFEPIIGKPGDGSSPHGAIVDEYHEHDTDHMVDTMQTGMGARRQPLLSVVSTAGSTVNGACHEMQKDVQRILEGSVQDETVFGIIYSCDEDDEWDSDEAILKANPNYGISVFPEFLKAQLAQAQRSAAKQNSYRTKHLNQWVGAKTAWMNMMAWNKQRMPRDMRMEDFKGYPCRISADLSSKKDVSAVDVTFMKGAHYYSFKKFFVPEAVLEENDRYIDFVTAGELDTTDGSMIDQEMIEEYIADLLRNYSVIDTTFDEWNAAYMMTRLSKLNTEVVSFPFNVRHVSEPMKQLEALILDGKYWHCGNSMNTWMMGNVAARLDVRGNIFPNKDRPNDPKCKIDGVTASIMNIARWMVHAEPEKSYNMFFVG
jgi:phage terminase large subunit-like protein